MGSDEVNVDYSEHLHKGRICFTAPCLKFLSRKLDVLPGLIILMNSRSFWSRDLENGRVLDSHEGALFGYKRTSSRCYWVCCSLCLVCLLVNHKLKCHFHLFNFLPSHWPCLDTSEVSWPCNQLSFHVQDSVGSRVSFYRCLTFTGTRFRLCNYVEIHWVWIHYRMLDSVMVKQSQALQSSLFRFL